MTNKEEGLGSVKRFGVRYGRTVKHNMAKIEKLQRKPQKCPYCNKLQVSRIAVGIWLCNKCGSKFTGNAYYLEAPVQTEEVIEEEKPVAEELVEDEEELAEASRTINQRQVA